MWSVVSRVMEAWPREEGACWLLASGGSSAVIQCSPSIGSFPYIGVQEQLEGRWDAMGLLHCDPQTV